MRRMKPNAPGGLVDRQVIEARAAELLGEIGIPQPWDRDELARRLTAKFGKLWRILPSSASVEAQKLVDAGVTGVIIETESSVTIFYADTGSELHQMNIILHELAHWFFGDVTKDRVLCRTDFVSPVETRAELFARTVLHRQRGRDTLHLAPHKDDHPGVVRLGEALADPD